MPLVMTTNLSAGPSDVANFKKSIAEELDTWLGDANHHIESDLTLYCRGVKLFAHQVILASHSPHLSSLFSSLTCPHKRQHMTIVMDVDHKATMSVLSLLYRGTGSISQGLGDELKGVVAMLGLSFTGGFQKESTGIITSATTTSGPVRPVSATAMNVAAEGFSKVPKGQKRDRSVSGKANSPGKKIKVAVNATERMRIHVSLTMALKGAPAGTTALCKMPACGVLVKYEEISQHFLMHEKEDKDTTESMDLNGDSDSQKSIQSSPRQSTQIRDRPLKDKLKDLVSDSSDDSDTDEYEAPEQREADPPKEQENVKCPQCGVAGLSSWHLHPDRHTCKPKPPVPTSNTTSINAPYDPQCTLCSPPLSFKTVKAKIVHIRMKHSSTHVPLRTVPSQNKKRHGCQICTKNFPEFAQLRTHYTLYHFWDKLEDDYGSRGEECHICFKSYPTHDHLLQHLGNFHCLIDPYLVKKGLRMVTHGKTIKLLSLRCEICQANIISSSDFKSHLAVKHFNRELTAEFPMARTKRKCPKCFKVFEGCPVATVIGHIGSVHDEVLKYAANYLDMDTNDRALLPVDDFDDNTVGVPIEKEKGTSPSRGVGTGKGGVFAYLTCQICQSSYQLAKDLKWHYLSHYQLEFQAEYSSLYCPHCSTVCPSYTALYRHLVVNHATFTLIPLMMKDGLWCGKSKILDKDAAKLHKLDVKIKKLKPDLVKKCLEQVQGEEETDSHGEYEGDLRMDVTTETLGNMEDSPVFYGFNTPETHKNGVESRKKTLIVPSFAEFCEYQKESSNVKDQNLAATESKKVGSVLVPLRDGEDTTIVPQSLSSMETETSKVTSVLVSLKDSMDTSLAETSPPSPRIRQSPTILEEKARSRVATPENEAEKEVEIKKENEIAGDDIRSKIRDAFGDDTDSD